MPKCPAISICLTSVCIEYFIYCLLMFLLGRSLFWVAMLGLVVLYIYGLVSYAAYQSYFDDPGSGSHCRTLFQCVVSVIRLGLIGGGGLVTVSSCSIQCIIQYVTYRLWRSELDGNGIITVRTWPEEHMYQMVVIWLHVLAS